MKRKYLSALLMGALTVTSVSTFTSCKDYDSDISNLQGQIDKAALKTEVEAMKTTVEAAKTTAEAAKEAAEKAQGGADLTEITNKVTALSTQVADAVKAGNDAKAAADEAKDGLNELELKLFEYYTADEIDNLLKELEEKITGDSESFDELKKTVESYSSNINKLYSAVTGVSLVIGNSEASDLMNGVLQFKTGTIKTEDKKDYTFGAGEYDKKDGNKYTATPTYTYKNGQPISFSQELLVRVNPVNANITKDMLKLVDSQGNDLLGDLLEVDSVSQYNELLTKASSQSGLWKITLKMKEGKKGTDLDACKDEDKLIAYAVAVNNTASQKATDAASRYVVSEYAATVEKGEDYTAASDLSSVKVKAESEANDSWHTLGHLKYWDGSWKQSTPSPSLVYAQNGEKITVSFEDVPAADRFYVVLDEGFAEKSSNESEYNAWKSYDYSGLNKVYTVDNGTGKGEFTVTIPSTAKAGDEVQFRIFAMNYDGTFVGSEYGQAFRVYVGAQTTTAEAIGNAEFTGKETLTTGWQKLTGSLSADGTLHYKSGDEITLVDAISKKEITAIISFAADENGTKATSDDKIAYFKVDCTDAESLQNWTNEGLASCVITDGASTALAKNSLAIKVTKKMPTEETAKAIAAKLYNWSAKQLVDGTYTAYLYPSTSKVESTTATASWNANAKFGYKYLKDAISSFGTNKDFVVTIANAAINAADDNKYTSAITADSQNGYVFQIGDAQSTTDLATLVDNETAHASTIGYNFGKISSVETAYGEANGDFIVPVENYNTVFACALDESVQTYTWTKAKVQEATKDTEAVYQDMNVITYGNYWSGNITLSDGKTIENVTDYIIGANSYDSSFKGSLKTLLKEKYVSYSVKLISDDTQKEDYFTASFKKSNGYPQAIDFTPKKVEASANPTEDVPSHLVITAKDAFGHEHVISVPFTVKKK